MTRPTILLTAIFLTILWGLNSPVTAAPGDLDTTFSGTGLRREAGAMGSLDRISATALQPDGKLVSVGYVAFDNGYFANCGVSRHNPDGSLDPSFDGDGKFVLSLGFVYSCEDVALQADGKIVIVGYTTPAYDLVLLRYNPNGSLDTTFDGDGILISDLLNSELGLAVEIQTDGKIVLCGVWGSDFLVVRYNTDGSLDSSFDGDGWVTTDFAGGTDQPRAIAIQPDGKIVVGGNTPSGGTAGTNDFAIVRYNPDGSLDTSFHNDGRVSTPILSDHDNINAIVVHPNGKIVAGGQSWISGGHRFGLARYNSNGTLDTSFDGDGVVVTDVTASYDILADLAQQADGKVVAVGTGGDSFGVVRYNIDGSLDTGFDGDGKFTTQILSSSYANAVVIQSDSKIVVAGRSNQQNSFEQVDFALIRLNTDGTFDLSFDGDGKVASNIHSWKHPANAAVVQADGKIVVVGVGHLTSTSGDFAVHRYNPNGTPDISFDGDGKVITNAGNEEEALAVALQTDGKIIVAGYSYQDAAVYRYTPTGSLDTSFNGTGIRTESGGGGNAGSCRISAIVVQPDGKILAGGGCNSDFTIYRYNADGTRDNSFDGDGKVQTDISVSVDAINAMSIQADGRIVVAGIMGNSGNNNFVLARYNSNGSLDSSFDGDGKVTTDFTPGSDLVNAMKLQGDGKIVAAGFAGNDTALVRYNTDGSLDTSFDGDGKVTISVSTLADGATGLAIQANGKIITSGYATNVFLGQALPPNRDIVLMRFNLDGSLDTAYGNNGKAVHDFTPDDRALGIALDSIGRIVMAGDTHGEFTVARFQGDVAAFESPFDFDGDGKTDISIFRPSTGDWWYLRSSDGQASNFDFGTSTSKLAPGDYTGDGKCDIAFFRPTPSTWFILRSENNATQLFAFGIATDVPAPGDFDGDNKADATLYRPSEGNWYIRRSTDEITTVVHFGLSDDVPVPLDYDGDGKTDVAIYRPSLGQWWIRRSGDNSVIAFTFGTSSDKPIPGDYTGDGKADAAVWRPSTGEWFVLRSEDYSYYAVPFGTSGDIPAPGDYDGDGKFDTAVFRPSNGNWYINRTTAGLLISQFGQAGDRPVPSAFVP